MHPVAHLGQRLHAQSPVDGRVLADWTSVEFTKTDLILATLLAKTKDQVAPHFHLSLPRVNILLDPTGKLFGETEGGRRTYV